MINFLIIHYNTPDLTGHLVKSINKFHNNAHIYIYDNSDITPFRKTCSNVTIFDNTKGQIINFDKWLNNYPNRNKSLGKRSNFGSAKHCKSVEIAMGLINDNFILLDSDVLLKKNVEEIYDENMFFSGEIENWSWGLSGYPKTKRVLPFICFINNKKCQEKKISYFNDEFMVGLYKKDIVSDSYDTGGFFYEMTKDLPHKDIKVNDYIVHFHGASYTDIGRDENVTKEIWLNKYKNLWEYHKKYVVYTAIIDNYDTLSEPEHKSENFDYICLTNTDIKTNTSWEIKKISDKDIPEGLTSEKKQRYIKLHPHIFFKEYEISLYVDGNVKIQENVEGFIKETITENDIIYIPLHPVRKCLYEEGKVCQNIKKDTPSIIKQQMEKYKDEGFPHNYGLTQNNIILRKHNTPKCIEIMEKWWNEVKTFSYRDQLSLYYVLWKNNFKIKELNKALYNSKWFFWNGIHIKSENNIENIQKTYTLLSSNSGTRYIVKKYENGHTKYRSKKRLVIRKANNNNKYKYFLS